MLCPSPQGAQGCWGQGQGWGRSWAGPTGIPAPHPASPRAAPVPGPQAGLNAFLFGSSVSSVLQVVLKSYDSGNPGCFSLLGGEQL